MKTLDELPVGCAGVVERLEGTGPTDRRLMDLGLLPDTSVRVVRRAPLGDPTVYALRGYQLCLRRAEARRIQIRAIDAEATAE